MVESMTIGRYIFQLITLYTWPQRINEKKAKLSQNDNRKKYE